MKLSRREFEQAVADALADVPSAFRPYLDRLVVDIEPMPDDDVLDDLELDDPTELLGLYQGTPLTDKSVEHPDPLGERIVIYQRNLERICRTRAELVEEIRCTVLHELGHHFGLDEDDLDELGYG